MFNINLITQSPCSIFSPGTYSPELQIFRTILNSYHNVQDVKLIFLEKWIIFAEHI